MPCRCVRPSARVPDSIRARRPNSCRGDARAARGKRASRRCRRLGCRRNPAARTRRYRNPCVSALGGQGHAGHAFGRERRGRCVWSRRRRTCHCLRVTQRRHGPPRCRARPACQGGPEGGAACLRCSLADERARIGRVDARREEPERHPQQLLRQACRHVGDCGLSGDRSHGLRASRARGAGGYQASPFRDLRRSVGPA